MLANTFDVLEELATPIFSLTSPILFGLIFSNLRNWEL